MVATGTEATSDKIPLLLSNLLSIEETNVTVAAFSSASVNRFEVVTSPSAFFEVSMIAKSAMACFISNFTIPPKDTLLAVEMR